MYGGRVAFPAIMSEETATASAPAAAPTPKKKAKATAAKKPKTAPSHPKVSEMVVESISTLKERGGSSLQAIKKHITANNKVDIDRLTPFIRKYLRQAVENGTLVQTKGKGANGSFKIGGAAPKSKTEKPKEKKVKKETATPKKAKTPVKKALKPKAKVAEKKKPAAKKPVAAKKTAKPKSPKKVVKATKPKAPKAKKLKTPTKKAAPKKNTKK